MPIKNLGLLHVIISLFCYEWENYKYICNSKIYSQITRSYKEGICEYIFIKTNKYYQPIESVFTETESGEQYRYFDADVLKNSFAFAGYVGDEFLMDSAEIALFRLQKPLRVEHLELDTCQNQPDALEYLIRKNTKSAPNSYARVALSQSNFFLRDDTLKVVFQLSGVFLSFGEVELSQLFGATNLIICEKINYVYKKGVVLLCGNALPTNAVKPKGFKKPHKGAIFKLYSCLWVD